LAPSRWSGCSCYPAAVANGDWLPERIEDIDLMTRQEVADLLRVDVKTVERLVKRGERRVVKIPPGLVRFHRRDVVALVRRHTYG
jgi:excisionase family DNA binding protein